MSITATTVGLVTAAVVGMGAMTVAPDAVATLTGASDAVGLTTETSVLAQAIATDFERPESLTCVADPVDLTRPCASFAEYDYEPIGDYVYSLTWTSTEDFVLYGATADNSQWVVFDTAAGGIRDLSGTELANAEAWLESVEAAA